MFYFTHIKVSRGKTKIVFVSIKAIIMCMFCSWQEGKVRADNLILHPHWQLTHRQTAWNDVRCPIKMWEFMLHHNVRHLGQSEDWIFWVSLEMQNCNVLRNERSRYFVGHWKSFQVLWIRWLLVSHHVNIVVSCHLCLLLFVLLINI